MEEESRREMRRRKILENAEARLRMIAGGRSHREGPPDNKVYNGNLKADNSSVECNSDVSKKESRDLNPSHSTNVPSCPAIPDAELQNGSAVSPPVKEKPVVRSEDATSQQSEALQRWTNMITGAVLAESLDQVDRTVLVRGNANSGRVYIIMALFGVCVRLMYEYELGWMFNQLVLLPFLVVTCPLLYSNIHSSLPPTGILPSVLLMSGIPPHRIKYLFDFMMLIRCLFQFFSVYFLSFIISHRFVQYFTNVT